MTKDEQREAAVKVAQQIFLSGERYAEANEPRGYDDAIQDGADSILGLQPGEWRAGLPDGRPEFDPLNAIRWVTEGRCTDAPAETFLTAWEQGDFMEWPDFVAWASALPSPPKSEDGA